MKNLLILLFIGNLFGGYFNDNFLKYSKTLQEFLIKDNVKILGEPIKATYNGPMTPFFLRRNEVMIRVDIE